MDELARFFIRRCDEPANDADAFHRCRDFFDGLQVAFDECRALDHVPRGVSADGHFRECNKFGAALACLVGEIDDLGGIAAEVTHGWVDLSKSDLHTNSVMPQGRECTARLKLSSPRADSKL